jgi:hypothetical protein
MFRRVTDNGKNARPAIYDLPPALETGIIPHLNHL